MGITAGKSKEWSKITEKVGNFLISIESELGSNRAWRRETEWATPRDPPTSSAHLQGVIRSA